MGRRRSCFLALADGARRRLAPPASLLKFMAVMLLLLVFIMC